MYLSKAITNGTINCLLQNYKVNKKADRNLVIYEHASVMKLDIVLNYWTTAFINVINNAS